MSTHIDVHLSNSSRCVQELAVLAYRTELPSLLPIVPPPLRKSVLSESSLLLMAFLDVNDDIIVLCEDQLSCTLFEVPKILPDWVAIKAVEQILLSSIYMQYLRVHYLLYPWSALRYRSLKAGRLYYNLLSSSTFLLAARFRSLPTAKHT